MAHELKTEQSSASYSAQLACTGIESIMTHLSSKSAVSDVLTIMSAHSRDGGVVAKGIEALKTMALSDHRCLDSILRTLAETEVQMLMRLKECGLDEMLCDVRARMKDEVGGLNKKDIKVMAQQIDNIVDMEPLEAEAPMGFSPNDEQPSDDEKLDESPIDGEYELTADPQEYTDVGSAAEATPAAPLPAASTATPIPTPAAAGPPPAPPAAPVAAPAVMAPTGRARRQQHLDQNDIDAQIFRMMYPIQDLVRGEEEAAGKVDQLQQASSMFYKKK